MQLSKKQALPLKTEQGCRVGLNLKILHKKKEIDSKLSRLDHCFLYKYICISKSKKDGEGGGCAKYFV